MIARLTHSLLLAESVGSISMSLERKLYGQVANEFRRLLNCKCYLLEIEYYLGFCRFISLWV